MGLRTEGFWERYPLPGIKWSGLMHRRKTAWMK